MGEPNTTCFAKKTKSDQHHLFRIVEAWGLMMLQRIAGSSRMSDVRKLQNSAWQIAFTLPDSTVKISQQGFYGRFVLSQTDLELAKKDIASLAVSLIIFETFSHYSLGRIWQVMASLHES